MNIYDFWKAVLGKNEIEIRKYFQNDAYINWQCTNEQFDVDEFIIDVNDENIVVKVLEKCQ